MMAEMKAQFGSLTAKMDAWLERMKDCWEVTEARNQGKPNVRLAWNKWRPWIWWQIQKKQRP
jgi:hypothetical protein